MTKRILLIIPQFYGIENKIKSTLEASGDEVVLIENKSLALDYHGTKAKCKLLRRAYFWSFSPEVKYLKGELEKIEDHRFDILFSINCFVISPFIFNKLKKINQNLFAVLYLWDSFAMYNWEKEFRLFDKVYTFDRSDSEKFHIEYKPNFYLKSLHSDEGSKYDLFFAGKFSSQRFSLVNHIFGKINDLGLKSFIKLWTGYKMLFHNKAMYNLLKEFTFKSQWVNNYLLNYKANEGFIDHKFIEKDALPYEEMHKYLLSSNVVLDLPFEYQSGFSHRLIEALANGKKIITTNASVKKEEFFNPNQIHIMDKRNPVIDKDWIKEKSTFQVDSSILQLELSKWVKSILPYSLNPEP